MGILQSKRVDVGDVGDLPGTVKIVTTDNLSTVTTAGYFNNAQLQGVNLSPSDIIYMIYSYVAQTNSGTFGIFTVSQTLGVITVSPWVDSGNVLLPVVSGDFAVFNGTAGQIKDSGSAPSAASQAFVVMSPGSVTIGQVPKFSDVNGTLANSGILASAMAISTISNPDAQSDLIWYDITASAAALATAGKVNIQLSSGTKQYQVRDIKVNQSTGLSGGGGNRLLSVTDGTSVWNNAGITAALLGTPIPTVWGGTGNPLPVSPTSFNTLSVAGLPIYLQYIGGTTDYTTGSVIISVLIQRAV
jgi:hypothetical protein